MATKRVEAIFKLRRDNDYNYEKVKDTFIPAKDYIPNKSESSASL